VRVDYAMIHPGRGRKQTLESAMLTISLGVRGLATFFALPHPIQVLR